jgi:hypothetical protein
VARIARHSSTAVVSGSGLWLIGGVLLFSVAVLAWALQGDSAARPVRPARRPVAARRSYPDRVSTPKTRAPVELAERPPSVASYGPLLEGNAFQPRVILRRNRGARSGSQTGHPAPGRAGRGSGGGAHPKPGEPTVADAWHEWKYNGIAQIDQKTYALMDQANKKESRFVKVGDRLEDATVARVAENQVALRQADGNVVVVQRVDTMADLLRPSRSGFPAAPGATPAPTGSIQPALSSAPGPLTVAPPGQAGAQPGPANAAVDDAARQGRQARPERRSQQPGSNGNFN